MFGGGTNIFDEPISQGPVSDIFGASFAGASASSTHIGESAVPADVAALGRIQDTQVCPDRENERVAVCRGGRAVEIFRRVDGCLTLESTLTGFTGAVLRCAWHFHQNTRTGDKIYLLASSCDNGQVLIHQQTLECVNAGDLGMQKYVVGHWIVSFQRQHLSADSFGPVTSLEWMPAGALNDPAQTRGVTEQPFMLAAGSDQLALVSGWLSKSDGGIEWEVTTDCHPATNGSIVTAVSWAPLQNMGDSRHLVAAICDYDEDFEPTSSHLSVFDFRRTSEPRFTLQQVTIIRCDAPEWEGWVRDVAWTDLPWARNSRIAVAFKQRVVMLTRAGDGRWHLRELQIFRTAGNDPPSEVDLTTEASDVWHLSWSRHHTLLAITADVNKTIVVRKVACGNTVPEASRTLLAGTDARVTTDDGNVRNAIVLKDSNISPAPLQPEGAVQVRLLPDDLPAAIKAKRNRRKRTPTATITADRVQALDLINVYDTAVGGRGPKHGATSHAQTQVPPTNLDLQTVTTDAGQGQATVSTGGLEMWEVVNVEQLQQLQRLESTYPQ